MIYEKIKLKLERTFKGSEKAVTVSRRGEGCVLENSQVIAVVNPRKDDAVV